jgi:tetratricopeptide (TPR) repeat protein
MQTPTCYISVVTDGSKIDMNRLDQDLFFGDLLRTLRKQQRLTQQQLAARIGATRETISLWERGNYKPNTTMLYELVNVLRLAEQEKRLLFEAHVGTASILPLHNLPEDNLYFTGREAQLQQLHQHLSAGKQVVLTQAINGLGGVGKTQLALAYAYRYREHYHDILWVCADTRETFIASYIQLATLLNLSKREEQDQQKVVEAVKRWLWEHKHWLLILDNVEDLGLVRSFLPSVRQGAVLLTTRLQVTEPVALSLPLECLSEEEGALLLLRRAKRLKLDDPLSAASIEEQQMARAITMLLGGLPLALDQAGAYIVETGCGLAGYLTLYEQRHAKLLARRGNVPSEHPDSVVTTFFLAFERVKRENPAAVDLLRLCAFLAPDAIPEALIINEAVQLGESLQSIVEDPWAFNKAIEILRCLSLIQRHAESKTLSVHRLVQTVLKDAMSKDLQHTWITRCSRLLERSFPTGKELNAEQREWCKQLLPHVLLNTAYYADQEKTALPETASLCYKAATYLRDGAQYGQAETLYQQALHLQEQLVGFTHPDLVDTLYGLATLYVMQGKYTEAEPLYQRALYAFDQVSDAVHPDIAHPLYGLATLYCEQGRYTEAEPLFKRALALFEQTLDPAHPDIARVLNGLAILYKQQGRYVEAEPLLQRALRIFEQASDSMHPLVGYPANNLAEVYREQGLYDQAEPLFQRALQIWEQALGPEHPLVAHPLNNLAEVYREQGQYDQAEPLLQRALHIWEQALGSEHTLVAAALNSLSEVYREQGQYEQAETLARRALKIREQALGPENPLMAYSLNNLAEVYCEQGQYEQADSLARRALKIREQALGPEHSDTAISLNTLAMISLKQGKYVEAEPLLRRALKIQEQVLGPMHPKLLAPLENYARLLTHLHRGEEAAEFEARAKSIRGRH